MFSVVCFWLGHGMGTQRILLSRMHCYDCQDSLAGLGAWSRHEYDYLPLCLSGSCRNAISIVQPTKKASPHLPQLPGWNFWSPRKVLATLPASRALLSLGHPWASKLVGGTEVPPVYGWQVAAPRLPNTFPRFVFSAIHICSWREVPCSEPKAIFQSLPAAGKKEVSVTLPSQRDCQGRPCSVVTETLQECVLLPHSPTGPICAILPGFSVYP